jgi:hypothetical protein
MHVIMTSTRLFCHCHLSACSPYFCFMFSRALRLSRAQTLSFPSNFPIVNAKVKRQGTLVGPSTSGRFKSSAAASASTLSNASSSRPKELGAESSHDESISAKDEIKVDARAKQADDDTLPYLPRPLGVPEPPSTLRKSWKDATMELMDQDVRLARRKHM